MGRVVGKISDWHVKVLVMSESHEIHYRICQFMDYVYGLMTLALWNPLWCTKVCLRSFRTGGKVSGNKPRMKVRDHSQFVQHENIRMIFTFSVLTSFRQVLILTSGEFHICVQPIPVFDKMSTFHDISFGMREMYMTILMLLPGAKRSWYGLPKEQNSLSAGIWFMFHSILRILSLCDMIRYICVSEDDGELVSFPSSQSTHLSAG